MAPGVTMNVLGATPFSLQEIEEKFVQNVRTHYNKFLDIWQQFGLDEACITARSTELWGHLQTLMEQMFEEDYGSYQKVEKRIKTLNVAIEGLANVLQVDVKDIDGPLFKKERELQEELQNLTRLKRERTDSYVLLKSEETEYRRLMLMGPADLVRAPKVPSENDLKMLRQKVSHLKAEQERRMAKMRAARKELSTILETTEWTPETVFERRLMSEEEILLSQETMDLLERAVSRARLWREELEGRRQGLEQKLNRLWTTLKVEEKQRTEFLQRHQGCQSKILKSMELEVQRLETLRRQRMQPLVQELRRELEDLWEKCHVSESERRHMRMDSFSEVTGQVLELHEDEVAKWKTHHGLVGPILKKIGKRQRLWEKMIAFENNANNHDRYKNRRGNLLTEEKERKKLQKELPSLENEIFKDIEDYESTCDTPFMYYGEDYRVFVSNQWAQRLNQKEFQKLERRKQRSLESTAVSTPSQKLLRSTRSTPRKASGSSNCRTPLGSHTPNVIKTPLKGRLFSPRSTEKEDRRPKSVESVNRKGRLFSPRSSEKEDYRPKSVESVNRKGRLFSPRSTEKDYKPAPVESLNSKGHPFSPRSLGTGQPMESINGTTYSIFVDNLNNLDKSNFHSSVLERSSKKGKVLKGNKSKKGGFLRKSARNVSKVTAKLTPKRGKLGLPFLI